MMDNRTDFRNTAAESKRRWETNADYWDERMGDKSNYFHNSIVRPDTERLLDVKVGDLVLDVACGNGNFSQRLVEMGATVVAFDYSEKLIRHAKRRRTAYLHKIDFHVCDATDYAQLIALKREKPFVKAVANMAIMDIADIEPLFKGVYEMLKPGGSFVFSTHHPCFVKPHDTYVRPCFFEGLAIKGQPVMHFYYHRSLDILFNIGLSAGFVLDGFCEKVDEDKEAPVIIIIRLLKPQADM